MSSPPRPAPRSVRATRRGLLVGSSATLLAAAACGTPGDPEPGAPAASSSDPGTPADVTSPTPTQSEAGPTGNEAADVALVARVRGDLAATAGLVLAAQRSVPALRSDLTPLLRLHRGHARVLGEPIARVRTARRPAPRLPLLGLVRDREEALHESLTEAALMADSGGLARLLASMAAGLGQELAVLPTGRTGPRGGGA